MNHQNLKSINYFEPDFTSKLSNKSIVKKSSPDYSYQKSPKQQNKIKSFFRQSLTINPQQQQIKMLVKQFLKQHNVNQLRQKITQQKRNLRTSMQRKSYNNKQKSIKKLSNKNKQKQKTQTYQQSKILFQNNIRNNKRSHSYFNNSNQTIKHINQIDLHHLNCQKCKNCKCKNHHCQVKIQLKDPISRFQTNNILFQREVKRKSIENSTRPEMQASFYANKLKKLPQYHQKLQNFTQNSSYQAQYQPILDKCQKVQNIRHLKNSSVKFGPKQIKNYESAYTKQFNNERSLQKANKGQQPFIVKQPQNLNTFGLKYHSIDSNYHHNYQPKQSARRSSLRPRDLLKDLDLYLIKQSKYKQQYSPRSKPQSSLKLRQQQKRNKIIHHHLSSSFIPMDEVHFDSNVYESNYKKEYKSAENDVFQFACPYGGKSSNGAASKYY